MMDVHVDNTPAVLAHLPASALSPGTARRAFYRLRQEAWHFMAARRADRNPARR
ncbi:hypothetical protein ACFYM0_02855 [Streptomyces sp. NPDC006487]|uniref:hypothetical protein n=1 Tax=Streptomyces sp. NPDC006487 TaxID=3364748 RepID=UPI0036B78C6E